MESYFKCFFILRTIDKTNFKNLVSICPVTASESPNIHLVVVTGMDEFKVIRDDSPYHFISIFSLGSGVRLYYSTMSLNCLQGRPTQLSLLHVRLPPGFAANALTHRPTKVHKALYSKGEYNLKLCETINYYFHFV